MKIVRIDHVSFTVADLERTTEFYERLGFERFKDYVSAGPDAEEGTGTPGAEIEIQWLRHPEGEAMLELLRYRNEPAESAAHNSRVGAAHLCLCVEDVVSEHGRLEGEGVEFVSPPHSDEFGVHWVYMRDPDGNVVELIQDPGMSADSLDGVNRKRVLFLYGGFPGHQPYEVAKWARGLMDELDFEVEETQDPHRLEADLTVYDLIVLGWTQAQTTEDLTDRAEARLIEAARAGTGFAGWHGMVAAFRASLPYSWIVGADFVEHPAGEAVRVPFEVKIVDREHPVTAGVESFQVASEQYYMHVDPAIHVLATTTFDGEPDVPWMAGVEMPVVYVKEFGAGRVFYAMGGHEVEEMVRPEMTRLVRQGMAWAAR